MGWDGYSEEDERKDFLKELIDLGRLEGAALGVTKQVIAKGVDSLSPRQKHVFDEYVLEEYTVTECWRCGSNIPWSEMSNALDNGSLCGYCEYQWAKIQEKD